MNRIEALKQVTGTQIASLVGLEAEARKQFGRYTFTDGIFKPSNTVTTHEITEPFIMSRWWKLLVEGDLRLGGENWGPNPEDCQLLIDPSGIKLSNGTAKPITIDMPGKEVILFMLGDVLTVARGSLTRGIDAKSRFTYPHVIPSISTPNDLTLIYQQHQ